MSIDFPENDLLFDHALYVRELQSYLREIAKADNRVPPITEDGVFGTSTTEAVKAAQRCAHLPENGRVDYATWSAIVHAADASRKKHPCPQGCLPYTPFTTPLCQGDCSCVVPFVQAMFNALSDRFLNFEKEPLQNEMTPVTCRNIGEIQRIRLCRQTNILDIPTWNALTDAFNLCATDRYTIVLT